MANLCIKFNFYFFFPIERERQKKSVIVIEPKLEAGNLESKSGKITLVDIQQLAKY